jgi:carboxymethylenebutenolidase
MIQLAALALLALSQDTPPKPSAPADPVAARLEGSPRHHEWVELTRMGRTLRVFVAFPEVKARVPAVIVIHENKGLTDWVRSVADQLAEAGYVALAPDLLSGVGPEGSGTEGFASTDAATKALYALDAQQVLEDLDAVRAHARSLPACDQTVSVAGFCWGGSKSFAYATHQPELAAAFVFYGSAPEDAAELAEIACPVYGFYGENDARINAGLPATTAAMEAAGKTFEPVVYPGAGHGFLRAGEAEDASAENKAARAAAWERWKALLAREPK